MTEHIVINLSSALFWDFPKAQQPIYYSDPRAEVAGQAFCAFCDNDHYVRVKETMVIEKLKHKP